MSVINKLYLGFSRKLIKEIEKSRSEPFGYQRQWFEKLIKGGRESYFGQEHRFNEIKNVKDFREHVPIRDYNAFVPYIERLRHGENYILWNQKVKWFAKSSGTSSDKSKFIPITPDSLHINHYGGFQRMLAFYVESNKGSKIFNGKALTLGGSVQLDCMGGSGNFSGDLSAILLENSPFIVEMLRTPSRKTALMADFNKKNRSHLPGKLQSECDQFQRRTELEPDSHEQGSGIYREKESSGKYGRTWNCSCMEE